MIIWGMIIYRIIKVSGDDNNLPEDILLVFEKDKISDTKDTFVIVANYRDPFLSKNLAFNPSAAQITNPSKKQALNSIIKQLNWPVIKYGGIIQRSYSGTVIGLLTINGKNYLVKKGNTFEEVLIEEIGKDSVMVVFGSSRKYIKRANSN